MIREMTIEIPGRPPTPNARRHWTVTARDNAAWKAAAHAEATFTRLEWEARHGMPWESLERATVAATFVVSTRARRDWDNLTATLKPLLDGCVDAGILLDDSNLVVESFGPFAIRHEARKTAVMLTIAEPA